MESEIKEIQKRRERVSYLQCLVWVRADRQELAKGGKVQALTELVNKLDNELAKVKTQLENTSGTLADDSKHVEEAKKAVKEVSPPILRIVRPH